MNIQILLTAGAFIASGLAVVPSATAIPPDVEQRPQVCGAPPPSAIATDDDIAARKAVFSAQRIQHL
jgi:hypothetical protein